MTTKRAETVMIKLRTHRPVDHGALWFKSIKDELVWQHPGRQLVSQIRKLSLMFFHSDSICSHKFFYFHHLCSKMDFCSWKIGRFAFYSAAVEMLSVRELKGQSAQITTQVTNFSVITNRSGMITGSGHFSSLRPAGHSKIVTFHVENHPGSSVRWKRPKAAEAVWCFCFSQLSFSLTRSLKSTLRETTVSHRKHYW